MGEFDFTGKLENSAIGKCPRCEAGRAAGTGAPRFSSRSITGATYQPARRGICRGSAVISLSKRPNRRAPCSPII